MKRLLAILAVAAVALVPGMGVAGGGATIPRGGTLRMTPFTPRDSPSLPFSSPAQLDQGTSAPDAVELFRCCLVRTLTSFAGLPADRGGAVVRPDLAVSLPAVSADGLTWTFRLRSG